jgi:type IV pilus assembly protein PilB
MNLDEKELKKILLKQNYVTEEDLSLAEKNAATKKVNLLDYLFDEKVINKNLLGQAIAEYYGLNYVDLDIKKPTYESVLKIPEELAKKYHLILVEQDDMKVLIVSDLPKEVKANAAEIQSLFKTKKIKLGYSFFDDIQELFNYYKKSLRTRVADIIEKDAKVAPELINEVIKEAISLKASDIHFEPQENDILLRFRIDGILQEVGNIQKNVYQNIINRIKVTAHIRIDEHFSAQDGAIRFILNENTPIDLRVSIVPTLDGEKIVIRILSQYTKQFTLSDLGLSNGNQELILAAAQRPFGMILTTGPTGSGKTTTLYAILKLLNNSRINITTIEDPVEYKVPGVNQIQVNPLTNLNFVQGLRSIVRQDPNVILVGEIRDQETAEITVNAALTGHLLLSTFHANDSATAIPRLFDMGIEPYLLASTLNLVVAQRLVRKICNSCKVSKTVSIADIKKHIPNAKKYFDSEEVTLYEGKGCSICNNTGYQGRIGIFEVLNINSELQDLMLKHPSIAQIWEVADKQDIKTFFDDGLDKVKSGITTLEELIRVAPPNIRQMKE